jgi:hypothetical protein
MGLSMWWIFVLLCLGSQAVQAREAITSPVRPVQPVLPLIQDGRYYPNRCVIDGTRNLLCQPLPTLPWIALAMPPAVELIRNNVPVSPTLCVTSVDQFIYCTPDYQRAPGLHLVTNFGHAYSLTNQELEVRRFEEVGVCRWAVDLERIGSLRPPRRLPQGRSRLGWRMLPTIYDHHLQSTRGA